MAPRAILAFASPLLAFWIAAGAAPVHAAVPQAKLDALARGGVFRHATVEQAWQAASAAKRPLIVMFTADGCAHCDRMINDTYGHPAVQLLVSQNSESALADDAVYRALAGRLGVRAYPTTVIVSGEGNIVDAVEGFLDPAAFAQRIAPWLAPRAGSAPPPAIDAVARSPGK